MNSTIKTGDALRRAIREEDRSLETRFAPMGQRLDGRAGNDVPVERIGDPLAHVSAKDRKSGGKRDTRVVLDTLALTRTERSVLKAMRTEAVRAGRHCSKSDVLRAGLHLLAAQPFHELLAAMDQLPEIKDDGGANPKSPNKQKRIKKGKKRA